MCDSIHLLYVDDNPAGLRARARLLAEYDQLEVTTAPDAEAAFASLADGDVDCLLSAYRIPDTDGVEFIRRVRNREPTLPVLVYTSNCTQDLLEAGLSAGMTDYVPKSIGAVSYDLLINRIENSVEQSHPHDPSTPGDRGAPAEGRPSF
jgi:CheY-like chemotaxis protein